MQAHSAIVLAAAAVLCGCATRGFDDSSASYADYLIGAYAQRSNDPAAAAERYALAVARNPRDGDMAARAADAALLAGDVATAARMGELARKLGAPTTGGALAASATALASGRAAEARRALAGLETEAGAASVAKVLETLALVSSRDSTQALAMLGAGEGRPRTAFGALRAPIKALILDVSGDDSGALEAYRAARAPGALRLAQVIEREGALLVRLGRRDEAKALFDAFLGDVDNPGVAAARAELDSPANSERARRPTVAEAAAIAIFGIAVIEQRDDPSEAAALPWFALATRLDPDLHAARIAQALALRSIEQKPAADAMLSGVPVRSAYYETAQITRGRALMADERKSEGVAVLETLAARPGAFAARRALADAYRGLERYRDAIPVLEALIAEGGAGFADDWRLHFALGAALERSQRWAEAEAALQKALAISPNEPQVLNYLGYSWVDRGVRVREGLALIERAVAAQPDQGYIIDSLGWAHFKLGNFAEAVRHLERAVELDPGDATLNDHLGDAYWRVGRRIEARYQWARAASFSDNAVDPDVLAAKQRDGLPALSARARP